MTIIRSPEKITTGFYIADKRNTENRKLSWGARGLLTFLLGKPDNWSVVIEHLIDQTKESAKPTGRDGVYSLLNELIEAGYVVRTQSRVKGKISSYDYFVYSSPQHDDPLTDSPLTDLPLAAKTTLISNDFEQENKSLKNDLLISKEATPALDKNPSNNVETLIIEQQPQVITTLINGFNELEENQGQTVKSPIVKEKVSQKRKLAGNGELNTIDTTLQDAIWAFVQSDTYWSANRLCKTPTAAFKLATTTSKRERGLMAQFKDWKRSQSPTPTTIEPTNYPRANFTCGGL